MANKPLRSRKEAECLQPLTPTPEDKPLKFAEHFHLPYLFNLTISLRKVQFTGKKSEAQEGQMLSKVTQPVGHAQGLEPRSPSTKSVLFSSYSLDLPSGHFPSWMP